MSCLSTHFLGKNSYRASGRNLVSGVGVGGQLPQDSNKLGTTQKLLQMGLDFLGLRLLYPSGYTL